MTFRIGCALWAYKDWRGSFFPNHSPPSSFLRLYSQQFSTVEGNSTFYSVPHHKTIVRWGLETPVGFQFCFKLPRLITHGGLLQPQGAAVEQFVQQMRALEPVPNVSTSDRRLGPFFAQLPPSYAPDAWTDLEAFLSELSQVQAEFALEVRHLGWFESSCDRQLNALLTKLGIGRVILDTRPIYEGDSHPLLQSEHHKPQLPVLFEATANTVLIRYISHPDPQVNQRFVEDWIEPVTKWLQENRRVYFFVHCPQEARSPANAQYIHQVFAGAISSIEPLTGSSTPSGQLSLF